MEQLWRTLRRLIFLLVTIFISANAIAYLILNNAFVHDWFRRQANTYLESFGMEASIGPIALNFLETKLTISGIKVSETGIEKNELAEIEGFVIGFDPWNLNSNWLPSLKFISVDGWKLDLGLLGRFKNEEKSTRQALRISEIMRIAQVYLGRQIEFKNGRIFELHSGFKNEAIVRSVFAKFGGNTSDSGLTIIAELGKASFCLSSDDPCSKQVSLESIEINSEMNSEGIARIERLDVRGGLGNWLMSGQVQFGDNFKIKNYNMKLDGESDSTPWFALTGLDGRGRFKASVFLNPEGSQESKNSHSSLLPAVHGQMSWSNLNLAGYDIYSGNAEIQYVDLKIGYKNATFRTPDGATIEGSGEYNLRDSMPYFNTLRVKQWPFMEMMAGLGIPTAVINFNMDSRELIVSGLMHAPAEKRFTLVISGLVSVSKMLVPNFEPNRFPLPNCEVNLRIDSDSRHMTFSGSSAQCGQEELERPTDVSLAKGLINYLESSRSFRFHVQSAPASLVSYFVREPIDGEMNFSGSIESSKSKPVTFRADVQLNDASVFGLAIPRLAAQISLDRNGFTSQHAEAWLEGDEQRPSVTSRRMSIGFESRKISVDARFDGKVEDLLKVFGEQGRQLSKNTRGQLTVSNFQMDGSLRDILRSDFQLAFAIRNLSNPQFKASDVKASLLCQQGWCSGSRLYTQNLEIGMIGFSGNANRSAMSSELPASKAIFEIESISQKSLSVRADVQSVPFQFKGEDGEAVSGLLDLRGSIQGGVRDWELSSSGRIDRFKWANNSLGSILWSASSHGGGPLNVTASGLFDQVQARMILDHSFERSTQLFMSLRSFELFKYIPALAKGNGAVKVTGEISSDMSVTAPGFKKVLGDFRKILSRIDGSGKVSKLRIQVGKSNFNLSNPVQIVLSDGELSSSRLLVMGPAGTVKTQGRYALETGFYTSMLEAKLESEILAQVSDLISTSTGSIVVNGEVEKSADGTTLRGEAKLENVSVAGKYFAPPITGLNGKIVFDDSRIEIPSLTGSKGSGQVDLIGTIDLATEHEKNAGEPALALRANMRSAQFRWPQEVFETVETTLDGQVEITGSGRPYTVGGEIRIAKGRAYRDATCQEFIRSGKGGGESTLVKQVTPGVLLNVGIEADNSFTIQSNCLRGRLSSAVRLSGSDVEPILSGQVRLDNGVLNLLKTRFDVTRAEAVFDNIVKIEPKIDAQMTAKIEKYNVFVGAEGPLSKPRLNIWSDPSTGPDGNPLTRPALIRMISTGRGPGETTQTAVTQALANQVVGLFDDPLSQAVSKITRGFVDRFELQPILDGGQSSWRARASRDLGEKFNLGLDYEPSRQSLTGTIFINESVNMVGGFDRRSSQIGSYSEISGGLKFQFGGK
ncbi:MAG: translocation/assembly module TamB domain-containing protein [Silvanigrellaceae bacterium]